MYHMQTTLNKFTVELSFVMNYGYFMLHLCDAVFQFSLQYVPAELLPVYIDKILPIADIVTPNQFEVE